MDDYRQCVEWCRLDDVTTISALTGRVLNVDAFEEQWVDRFRTAFETA